MYGGWITFDLEIDVKNAELIARLRLGASISRERKLNQGYDAVADEAADAIEALESQLAIERRHNERATNHLQDQRDALQAQLAQQPAELRAALDTAQQEPVNAMLVESLEQAHDMVDHWGCYASDYFQQKHDLVGDKAKINAALTAAKQAQQERAPLSLEKIIDIVKAIDEKPGTSHIDVLVEMTRAIEAAHGIKQGDQHD